MACHIISCFAVLSLIAGTGELVAVVVSPHCCLAEFVSQVYLPRCMLVLPVFRMLLRCSVASKGVGCTGCGFILCSKARLNKKANTTGRSSRPLFAIPPPPPSHNFSRPCSFAQACSATRHRLTGLHRGDCMHSDVFPTTLQVYLDQCDMPLPTWHLLLSWSKGALPPLPPPPPPPCPIGPSPLFPRGMPLHIGAVCFPGNN